jgi:hypothetical protein
MSRARNSLDTVFGALTDGSRTNGNGHSNAAAAPYRLIEKRSSYGFNNTLIESATQDQDRKQINLVDYDTHRSISVIGRRTLLSLARTMYWRIPSLQAAIREQANLAVTPFQPIFLGANEAWGKRASEWLDGFHAVMNIGGWPANYESYCETTLTSHIVDGDIFTLLTEDNSGNARVQQIASHRVGSRYQTGGICQVRYQGNQLFIDEKLVDDNLPYTFSAPVEWEATIIDGVILDDFGRALAYRVYSDPVVSAAYRDISARNLFPAFLPEVPDQVRGISLLASSVFDWQDVREFRRFEMLAQKAFSTRAITEQNETGDVDTSKAVIAAPAVFDSSGNKTAADMQKLDGGAYTYFKAGTGSKLSAFNWGDRPGRGSEAFFDTTVRDAFRGTEWDVFFSLDAKGAGGAPMRVIVDRVNRTLTKRRRLATMNIKRVDVYALAKAMKNGELPFDPDWYRWTYRAAADITADRRYESQTDLHEYEAGLTNLELLAAKRKGQWRQIRDQQQTEIEDKCARAKVIADKYDISIQEVLAMFGVVGTASFSMARRDTGTEALTSESNPHPGEKAGGQ